MSRRNRNRQYLSPRLNRKLRAVAVAATFGSLSITILGLYHFIGYVSESRAQKLLQKETASPYISISFNESLNLGNQSVTEFPILVSIRHESLKSTGKGGRVIDSSAKDLYFTRADGKSLIAHEIERYDAVVGKITAWLRIPKEILKDSILMFVGQYPDSTQSVFKDFASVWHFSGSLTSSATPVSGEYRGLTDEEGKIAGAKDFLPYKGGCMSFDRPKNFNFAGNVSISAWIYNRGSNEEQIVFSDISKTGGIKLSIDKSGRPRVESKGEKPTSASAPSALESNRWHLISAGYDQVSDSLKLYVDGELAAKAKGGDYKPGGRIYVGSDNNNRQGFFNGIIDELRFAAKPEEAEFHKFRFLTESNPDATIKLNGEESFSASPSIVTLKNFEGKVNESHVTIHWQTADETNLDYFTLERSEDGRTFQKVSRRFGNGNSDAPRSYVLLDPSPVFGNAYYRLRYTNFKGESEVSHFLNLNYSEAESALGVIRVDPNPFKDDFSIRFRAKDDADVSISLKGLDGKTHFETSVKPDAGGIAEFQYKCSASLLPGVYFLSLSQENHRKVVRLIKNT